MVVDVAIQRRDDVAAAGACFFVAVQRMGVRLSDQPHRRPTRVSQHGRPDARCGEREPQQLVGLDRSAQHLRVVAEITDLGRGLVDEAQHAALLVHRAAAEEWIAPRVDKRAAGGVEVDSMVPDHEVQSGRVPAAHLEPVERRERDLHRGHDLDCCGTSVAAGEVAHSRSGTEAVTPHGPYCVLQPDDRRVHRLELVGRVRTQIVEPGFDRGYLGFERPAPPVDARERRRRAEQRPQSGDALQEAVDFFYPSGCGDEPVHRAM